MSLFGLASRDIRRFLNERSCPPAGRFNDDPASPGLAVSGTAYKQWGRIVEELGGNIYHSEEWADISSSARSRPLFFHWTDREGRSAGAAVGVESGSRAPCLGRFSRRLDLESYPAVRDRDPALGRSLIRQLVDFAANRGCRSLSIQSYCSDTLIPGLDSCGFVLAPRTEFVLDLTQSTEALWKRLSVNHRRRIRSAEKLGMTLKEGFTADALEQMAVLLNATSERRNLRGDRMIVLEKDYYVEMGQKLLSRNLGRLFLITDNGVPVSAAFVTVYAGIAFYLWGGSSAKGCAMKAPPLLFWNIILQCRDSGCTAFNLGGVPAAAEDPNSPAHGLYRFKSSFGGRPVPCVSGTIGNLQRLPGLLLAVFEKSRNALKSL